MTLTGRAFGCKDAGCQVGLVALVIARARLDLGVGGHFRKESVDF